MTNLSSPELFYTQSVYKMTEPQPELPAVIPANRSDNFNAVTKIGNKAVSELVKVALLTPDKIVETIQKMVPEA